MRVMEIMWDIPSIPEPLAKPTPWHTSCPTVLQTFWAKTSNHQKPWSKMRISILALNRNKNGISPRNRTHSLLSCQRTSKNRRRKIPSQTSEEKEKESSRSKDRKKTKEKRKFPVKNRKKTKEKKGKFPIKRSEENKRERKDSWSMIGRKEKKYTERSSDQTVCEQTYRIVTSKQEKKGSHDLKWSLP